MATTRTPLMAGNWKSNLNHQEAVVLVQKLAWTLSDKRHDYGKVEVVVVPPFTDLRSVQTMVDGDRLSLKYGAQDVSAHDGGAYTGEISAAMLAKLGCSYGGGGLSDRCGGGVSSSLGGSSGAERNLDRLTVGIGLIWFACVIALGLLLAYGGI